MGNIADHSEFFKMELSREIGSQIEVGLIGTPTPIFVFGIGV